MLGKGKYANRRGPTATCSSESPDAPCPRINASSGQPLRVAAVLAAWRIIPATVNARLAVSNATNRLASRSNKEKAATERDGTSVARRYSVFR
jgi:hypothetical protein